MSAIPITSPVTHRRRRPDSPAGVGPSSRIHVHVDPAVKQAAQQRATREGVTLSLFVERMLREVVDVT